LKDQFQYHIMNNILSFLLLLLGIAACQNKGEYFPGATCISNITIIDAKNGTLAKRTVIIEEDRIVKIEKTEELKLAKENTQIDGTGKFMIPGLWDAHVHFAYIEELAPAMFDLFLAYGITSVRDTGGKIKFVKKWKDKALADPTAAPRVMIAGPLLDGLPNVYDGSSPQRPPLSVGIESVAAAEKMVDDLDAMGVDLLKAYEMLSPEQFIVIAKRAREKGLILTGHVPLSMDVISASNAGLNSMEHLRNLEMSTASNSEELLALRRKLLAAGKMDQGGILRSRIHEAQRMEAISKKDEAMTDQVLAVLAKNKTWQCPTLALSTAGVRRPFAREEWKETFKYFPDAIEEKWKSGLKDYLETEITESRKVYADWAFEIMNKINKAGVGILAGTDCPIFFLTPGYSLHEELVLLVKSGLTNTEAIASATLGPAKYFGMEKDLGTIDEGKYADLLILRKNPLEAIEHTKSIDAVIKAGKVYDRKTLDEMLSNLENAN